MDKNLQKYIPTFTDISDWGIITYANTGGSRAKRITVNPADEQEYFVKGSKVTDDGTIRYPMEFWSEIVSSKIGQYFGFNMLDYNIAHGENLNQKIGCISKSMIEYSENKLTEGKAYLTNLNPNYNPETDKKDYTFQFISEALHEFRLEKYIPNLVDVIIFDALIGNSDRHQENWGFITHYREEIEKYDSALKGVSGAYPIKILWWFLKPVLRYIHKAKEKKEIIKMQSKIAKNTFSPIYDSGCCLGREILDHKVSEMLKNNQMIEAYVNKGKSEIHWEGFNKKQNHVELVNLLKQKYGTKIEKTINRIKENYNLEAISEIINNIDKELPEELSKFKLSDARKQLMVKLVSLRAQKLQEIL